MELSNTPGSKVDVPFESLKLWKLNKKSGDMKTLTEKWGINRNTLTAAFNGQAQPELIEALDAFYQERVTEKEKRAKQLKQLPS